MVAADEIEDLVIDLDLEELQAIFFLDMVLVARIEPVRSVVYPQIVERDGGEEVGAGRGVAEDGLYTCLDYVLDLALSALRGSGQETAFQIHSVV